MSEYADAMAANLPHLRVTYQKDGEGKDTFGWGLTGAMPGAALVGFIGYAQAHLYAWNDRERYEEQPDEECFVIVWDSKARQFRYFFHPAIPVYALCGTLEMIKSVLVANQVSAQRTGVGRLAPQRRQLFGPDGSPMR